MKKIVKAWAVLDENGEIEKLDESRAHIHFSSSVKMMRRKGEKQIVPCEIHYKIK